VAFDINLIKKQGNLKYYFPTYQILKYVSKLTKIFIFAAILSILLSALPFSVNHVNATHTDCINWAGLADKDCDQLADVWETGNKTYTENGITVHLPPGVNMNHRDILIEIDYMSHHIPPAATIDLVAAKFNAMELLNADGTYGVNVHYIIDDNVAHKTCINVYEDSDTDETNDFKSIKENFMGTTSERSSNANFYQAKMDIFHYALFIHTRCGTTSVQQSSGTAENPGNDLIISLGYPGWGNVIDGHDTGSNDYKSATFMHELGHNLNLKHAGSTHTPNCKPNYISVMNYLFQFPTYVPDREIDYSHSVIPSLKESALVENSGIGPSSPVNLDTSVGHTTASHPGLPHDLDAVANNSPINYNWFTGSTVLGQTVSSSITNFHFSACNDDDVNNTAVGGKLFGYDDVHYNSLVFWANSGPFQNATAPPPQIISDVKLPTLPDELVANLSSLSPLKSSVIDTNESSYDILKDPKLPPCDITVSGCQDSPCDSQDPECKSDKTHNFTNPELAPIDVGVPANETELTASDVLQAISSMVLDINGHIQSINQSEFANGTDVTKLKKDLQNSLVNASDSVYALINSSKSDDALGKILKLRSLVDGTHSSVQILQHPNNTVLKLIDDLRIALEKRR
jgi:hypothetical protein